MSTTDSPRLGAVLLIGLNLLTWPFEYWTAKTVWQGNEQLQTEKVDHRNEVQDLAVSKSTDVAGFTFANLLNVLKFLLDWMYQYGRSLRQYFASEVWMPSLAMSTLHFSILTFSSTLIVFLVNAGFSMALITRRRGPERRVRNGRDVPVPLGPCAPSGTGAPRTCPSRVTATTMTLARARLARLCDLRLRSTTRRQTARPAGTTKPPPSAHSASSPSPSPSSPSSPPVPAIWHIATSWPPLLDDGPSAWHAHRPVALVVVVFIAASRLGRFTSALCAQQLAQSCVEAEERSVFAGTEAGFASGFGLAHYVVTGVWSRHEEFGFVALGSVVVVAGGTGLYAFWLLGRKGGRRRVG